MYQRRIYTPSFVLYQEPLRLLKTFGHQAEVTYKVRKSVYNTEMYFKQFFTCLERTSTFITSIFRTIYRSSSPEVFSKIGVLLQTCSIFTEEYRWSHTFARIFSCKLSKLFVEQLSWKNSGWLLLCIWKRMQHMLAGIHLFRVKMKNLEQGVKYVSS